MAIDQKLLLQAAPLYVERENTEYVTSGSLVPITRKRIVIFHALEAFRMVEGFIVLLRKAGVPAYYDWNSGYVVDAERHNPEYDLKIRVAKADLCFFLCTESSVTSEQCLKAYKFASLINRRIYVAHTLSGETEWALQVSDIYNQLDIDRGPGGAPRVKVLNQERRRLWVAINSESQL